MTADYLIFIIYAISGGILLAFISTLILKALLGSFISALIDKNATDILSAKTLEELGVKRNKLLLFIIKNNATLKRLVFATEGNKYYLPSENKLKAEHLYLKEKISVATLVIIVVLIIAVYLICDRVIPNIM